MNDDSGEAEKSSRRQVLVAIPAGAAGSIISFILTYLFSRPGSASPAPSAPCDPAASVEGRLRTVEDEVKALRSAFHAFQAAESDRSQRARIMQEVNERFEVLERAVRGWKR